jgi:hypothetical protein
MHNWQDNIEMGVKKKYVVELTWRRTGFKKVAVSYSVGTWKSSTEGKATGALGWSLGDVKISGAVTPVPYMPSWREYGQLHLFKNM